MIWFVFNQIQMEIDSSTSLLESQLVDAIHESLQNYLHSNASFLGERLLAERDCEDHRNLLADCYLAENKPNKAYEVLKGCKTDMARYKFAVSCMRINKLKDGERALNPPENIPRSLHNKAEAPVPNGSYGLYLLGAINERQQKYEEAKKFYLRALDMNPTLWSAYERLLKMGEDVMPNRVFSTTKFKTVGASKKSEERGDPDSMETSKIKKSSYPSYSLSSSNRKRVASEAQNIVSFLKKFADPAYDLGMYKCEEAIRKYKELPENQYATGWVLFQIGRAYMEMVNYKEAEKFFNEAHKIEPHRLEGLEYYSSCLWHLKKHVELTYLAYEASQRSLYSPETWITLGNCFSLFKEHELALKFFARAIQINPHNSYAYSLCGHEHVYNEDFLRAKKMFETALTWDLRHYNALWGLGNIAYKQEKYSKATENFTRAVSINPRNPVLYSFLGMTSAAAGDYVPALAFFQKSEELDPQNCLNKYQKANTLVKLSKYHEAIKELEQLHQLMPKEAPVLTLLGMIHKKLGKIEIAHNYLSKALDLECKDTQRIKGFIENLQAPGEQDENL